MNTKTAAHTNMLIVTFSRKNDSAPDSAKEESGRKVSPEVSPRKAKARTRE
jgi:hypothetical protein